MYMCMYMWDNATRCTTHLTVGRERHKKRSSSSTPSVVSSTVHTQRSGGSHGSATSPALRDPRFTKPSYLAGCASIASASASAACVTHA